MLVHALAASAGASVDASPKASAETSIEPPPPASCTASASAPPSDALPEVVPDPLPDEAPEVPEEAGLPLDPQPTTGPRVKAATTRASSEFLFANFRMLCSGFRTTQHVELDCEGSSVFDGYLIFARRRGLS